MRVLMGLLQQVVLSVPGEIFMTVVEQGVAIPQLLCGPDTRQRDGTQLIWVSTDRLLVWLWCHRGHQGTSVTWLSGSKGSQGTRLSSLVTCEGES